MKEESDIPLLKSYNKDTTVIETDPFMEKEIDELIRAYAQPQEIVRRLRDVGYSEEEVRQSYKFQFYCEILKQIQKDYKNYSLSVLVRIHKTNRTFQLTKSKNQTF